MKGLFNSDKGNLVRNLADVPCDVIQNLESDADAAEEFINQIQAGEIPSLITDLPQEAVSEFGDIIEVATQVLSDVAEAAVTDVVNIVDSIEDGSILDAVADIPLDLISAITAGWDDLTSEVGSVWSDVTCFFADDCTPATAPPCNMPAMAAATTTPAATPAVPSNSYTQAAATTTVAAAPAVPTNTYTQAAPTSTPDTQATDTPVLYTPGTARNQLPQTQSQASSSAQGQGASQTTQQPQQTTPPTQVESQAGSTPDWAGIHCLAALAIAVFGLALLL